MIDIAELQEQMENLVERFESKEIDLEGNNRQATVADLLAVLRLVQNLAGKVNELKRRPF